MQLGVVDVAHVEPIGREDGRDLDSVDAQVVQALLSVVHPFPNAVVAVSMVPDVGWTVSGRHLEAERTEPGAILVRPAFVPVGHRDDLRGEFLMLGRNPAGPQVWWLNDVLGRVDDKRRSALCSQIPASSD